VSKLKVTLIIFFMVGCTSTDNSKLGYNGVTQSTPDNLGALQTLESLKSNPDARFSNQSGWIIINVDVADEQAIYSFTPKSHPAYPSIVKREIVERNGAIHIDMSAKCSASKAVCDELIQQFLALNNQIKQSMQR
jgi:hypothetical protein